MSQSSTRLCQRVLRLPQWLLLPPFRLLLLCLSSLPPALRCAFPPLHPRSGCHSRSLKRPPRPTLLPGDFFPPINYLKLGKFSRPNLFGSDLGRYIGTTQTFTFSIFGHGPPGFHPQSPSLAHMSSNLVFCS